MRSVFASDDVPGEIFLHVEALRQKENRDITRKPAATLKGETLMARLRPVKELGPEEQRAQLAGPALLAQPLPDLLPARRPILLAYPSA